MPLGTCLAQPPAALNQLKPEASPGPKELALARAALGGGTAHADPCLYLRSYVLSPSPSGVQIPGGG